MVFNPLLYLPPHSYWGGGGAICRVLTNFASKSNQEYILGYVLILNFLSLKFYYCNNFFHNIIIIFCTS